MNDQNNERKSNQDSGFKKYAEVIIGAIIATFLVGGVAFLFKSFASKIENIEETIEAHHGPAWKEIEKIVAVGKLREEFLKAKADYDQKLLELKNDINTNQDKINKQISRLERLNTATEMWTKQGDLIMIALQSQEYETYAHLNKRAPTNKDIACLNLAHIRGSNFKVGDDIRITNIASVNRETVVAKICSTYSDLDNTDVLIQLAIQPANTIGFSENLGKLRVKVTKKEFDLNDPDRWRAFKEIKDKCLAAP